MTKRKRIKDEPKPPVVPAPEHEQIEQPRGLECPHCGCRHFLVLHTERLVNQIRRRRECRHCAWRTTTVERVVDQKKSATGSGST